MSAFSPRISSPARSRGPRRPPIALFLRVLVRRAKLDSALLEGADATGSAELELRARQLTSRRHRRVLADSLDEVLRTADRGSTRRIHATSPPLACADVRGARAALLELERALRRNGEVSPAGVLLAERLLTDGAGPLYVEAANDALWHAARDASAALDGRTGNVTRDAVAA